MYKMKNKQNMKHEIASTIIQLDQVRTFWARLKPLH